MVINKYIDTPSQAELQKVALQRSIYKGLLTRHQKLRCAYKLPFSAEMVPQILFEVSSKYFPNIFHVFTKGHVTDFKILPIIIIIGLLLSASFSYCILL